MIDKDLAAVLRLVGFNDKEARAYLALLELGKGTVTEIAKRSELKRSIVYYVIKHLEQRGFVHGVAGGKVKCFSAADPARVLSSAQSATEELRFMLPLMRALYDKGSDRPKIEYFEGKEAVVSVYRMITRIKGMRYVSSIHRINEIMPEEVTAWLNIYTKSRHSPQTKQLLEDTPADRRWAQQLKNTKEEIRMLPKDARIAMDLSISPDMLCLTSFDPLFIVVIHSEPIASSAATLFDVAWQLGKKVS